MDLRDGNLYVTIMGDEPTVVEYVRGDRLIILLGGGTKQRQQADIERAKAMWAEYKTRKAAAAKPRGKR